MRSRLLIPSVLLLSSSLLLQACGQFELDKNQNSSNSSLANHLGCVQGKIFNGLTGENIPLNASDMAGRDGVFIDVGTKGLSASLLQVEGETVQYRICDVPLDETYHMRVALPGYELTEGLVRIRSTIQSFSSEATQDITKLLPALNVNIEVFPRGVATQDMTFIVQSYGDVVEGATVNLRPSSPGSKELTITDSAGFLNPTNIGTKSIQVQTDKTGVAVIKAEDLVLGAQYEYVVLPPTKNQYLEPISGFTQLSIRDVSSGGNPAVSPYIHLINFAGGAPTLSALQYSSESQNYSDSGSLIITFNRKVELVPGTKDDIQAVLTNSAGASLATNIHGNLQTEQVKIAFDGYRMILTPQWDVQPMKEREGGLAITYAGIKVRPTTAPHNAQMLNVGASNPEKMTVKVFGATTVPSIAASVSLPESNGNNQAGHAGSVLPQAFKVQVLNQFGTPYVGSQATVQFTTTETNAGLSRSIDSGFSQTISVATDSTTGIASAFFRLGSSIGTQHVTATVNGLSTTVQFTATATARTSRLVATSGVVQSAPADSDLPAEIVVQVYDQNGSPMGSGVAVTASVNNGGKLKYAGRYESQVTTNTDSNGRISLGWRLGPVVGQQTLSLSSNGVAGSVSINALAKLASIAKVAGDNATGTSGSDVTLQVELRDHLGNRFPLASRIVRFEINSGDVALRANASDQVTTAQQIDVMTNSSGLATVTLRLGNTAPGSYAVVARHGDLAAVTFAGNNVGQ